MEVYDLFYCYVYNHLRYSFLCFWLVFTSELNVRCLSSQRIYTVKQNSVLSTSGKSREERQAGGQHRERGWIPGWGSSPGAITNQLSAVCQECFAST